MRLPPGDGTLATYMVNSFTLNCLLRLKWLLFKIKWIQNGTKRADDATLMRENPLQEGLSLNIDLSDDLHEAFLLLASRVTCFTAVAQKIGCWRVSGKVSLLSLISETTLRYGEGLNQTFQLLTMIEK
ncbi:hypothetical protein BT93_H1202 [Corymbia citriodora subsp. variegata]|nr:hypothetical protein BT93_H1202 [Corymbia citriodora subsp. variegata]